MPPVTRGQEAALKGEAAGPEADTPRGWNFMLLPCMVAMVATPSVVDSQAVKALVVQQIEGGCQ